MLKLRKGFTLIELLVVIGILGILLAIVLIAINPARQFAQANNTARQSDVTTILNAIHQYSADHHGTLPPNMPALGAAAVEIAGDGATVAPGNICSALVPTYVAALPTDPSAPTNAIQIPAGTAPAQANTCQGVYATGYDVAVDATGRVTVSAPKADAVSGTTPVIQVTR